MSDSRRRSRGKSGWQQGGSGKDRRVRRSDVHAWRKSIKGEDNSWRKLARRLRMLGMLALCGACIVLIVWLLWFRRRDQTLVAVVEPVENVTFESAAAPRGFAANDLNAIADLYKDHQLSPEGRFDFENLPKVTGEEKTLVFYYTGEASNFDGQDYLLNAKIQPDDLFDGSQKLNRGLRSLKKLWETAKNKKPKQKWVILLDVAAPPPDWRLSLFDRDPLVDLQEKIKGIPDLVVIGSATPGQQSWCSAHLGGGRSAFSYYVTEALSKKLADQAKQAELDTFINVGELLNYVQGKLDSWVFNNRSPTGQTAFVAYGQPNRKPEIDDFVVIHLEIKDLQFDPPSRKGNRGWKAFENTVSESSAREEADRKQPIVLRDRALFDVDPLRWRAWADQLLRAEQFALANATDPPQPAEGKSVDSYTNELKTQFVTLADQPPQAKMLVEHIFDQAWQSGHGAKRPLPNGTPNANDEFLPENQLNRAWKTFHELNGTNWETPQLKDVRASVERANDLRKQAEAAACSPLGTYHWIAPAITLADRYRRNGEDLLFLGESDKADQLFEQAEARYEQAQVTANNIAATRMNLQRLWAELPEMARWAAHNETLVDPPRLEWLRKSYQPSPGNDHRQPPPAAGLFAELLACFRETGRLQNDLLKNDMKQNDVRKSESRGEPSTELAPETLNEMSQENAIESDRQLNLSLKAIRHLNDLRDKIDETYTDLDARPYTAVNHVKIRDAARYSLLPYSIRERLFGILDECERATNNQSLSAAASSTTGGQNRSGNDADSRGTAADQRRERQLWQAAWSIEVLDLARRWNAAEGRDKDVDTDFSELWNAATKSDPAPDALRTLGDAIRREWMSNRKLLIECGKNDTDFSQLLRADQLARTLHGYDAGLLSKEQSLAARRLHEYFLADLYVSQAERFVEDFWDGWYDKAATACLAAAENSGSGAGANAESPRRPFTQIQERIDSLRNKLKSFNWNNVGLTITADGNDAANSAAPGTAMIRFPEKDGKLSFTASIGSDTALPAGQAVLAAQHIVMDDGPKLPVTPADFKLTGDRFRSVPIPIDAAEKSRWELTGASQYGSGDTLSLMSHLFYRGHSRSSESPAVDLAGPELYLTIAHKALPPPEKPGSVQVTGHDQRSIVFVLDCSLSMTKEVGNTTRFKIARTSLEGIVAGLNAAAQQAQIPVRAGLVVFGVGDTGFGVDTKVKLGNLNQVQLGNFTDQFNLLLAKGGTPLTAGIEEAFKNISAEKEGVDGIIVVITDGAEKQDRHTDKQKLAIDNNREALRTKLENLACPKGAALPRRIEVQLISFNTTDDEWADAESLQHVLTQTGKISCTATRVKVANKLVNALTKSVKQRPYYLQRPTQARQPEELRKTITNLMPQAAAYRVGFPNFEQQNALEQQNCQQSDVQEFHIHGGESIVYQLEKGRLVHLPGYGNESFQRETPAIYASSPVPPAYADRLALLDFETDRDGMILALAHNDNHNDSYVEWPRDIYFDVRGYTDPDKKTFKRPTAFTWKLVPGKSLPVWTISDIRWPSGDMVKSAEVDAVWCMQHPADGQAAFGIDEIEAVMPFNIGPYEIDHCEMEQIAAGLAVKMDVAVPETPDSEGAPHPALMRVRLARKRDGRFETLDLDQTTEFYEIPGTQHKRYGLETKFTLDAATTDVFVVLRPVDTATKEAGVGTAAKLDVSND